MRPARMNGSSTLVVIGAAILFILLAVLEAMAGPANPRGSVQRVDDALAKGDLTAAERAWQDAYTAALGSRRWEGMLEAGDAARRIGEASGSGKAADARARQAYLTALWRARRAGSLDGVLRAAEAFSALGDREVVAQCLRIAERLAAERRDAQARDQVLTLSQRLGQPTNLNH